MITKKHYIKIAEILNRQSIDLSRVDNKDYSLYEAKQTAVRQIIEDLANYFETDNPNFDKVKFKEACLK